MRSLKMLRSISRREAPQSSLSFALQALQHISLTSGTAALTEPGKYATLHSGFCKRQLHGEPWSQSIVAISSRTSYLATSSIKGHLHSDKLSALPYLHKSGKKYIVLKGVGKAVGIPVEGVQEVDRHAAIACLHLLPFVHRLRYDLPKSERALACSASSHRGTELNGKCAMLPGDSSKKKLHRPYMH